MDYTVGSIADIISGKNTPNKPAVVKKQFVNPNKNTENDVKTTKHNHNENDVKTIKHNQNENEGTPNKKKEALKRSKSTNDKRTQRSQSFKKNKLNTNTRDISSFTVIDHKKIENIEKDLKQRKISETSDDSMDTDTSKTHTNENIDKKEVNSRTIFVGNVSITVKKTQLLRYFGKYGKVVSVRLRCATPAQPELSKRVAVIKKMLHPKRTTLHCYVTFEKREDALKATELNGTKYKEHHLRVQMCDDATKPDSSKAIFVGNLPFDIEDDDLWQAFESCGAITSVRVVRNSSTGMGIGIGYVNFESSDAVELALQMEDVTIKNQKVRIQRCREGKNKRKEKYLKKQKKEKQGGQKVKKNSENATDEDNKLRHKKKQNIAFDKTSGIKVKNSVFQGSKTNKKKQRPKINRGLIQKMKLSQKIAPKFT